MPDLNKPVQERFGALMMAICESDAIISAQRDEIEKLKRALSDLSADKSASEAQRKTFGAVDTVWDESGKPVAEATPLSRQYCTSQSRLDP